MKAAAGTLKKVHAIRLEPGEDVMQSLQTFCEEHHIGNGAILTGVGSLRGCSYFDPTEIPDRPGYYGYGDPIELPCPIELIAMNGIICTEADGNPCTSTPPLPMKTARNSADISTWATWSLPPWSW